MEQFIKRISSILICFFVILTAGISGEDYQSKYVKNIYTPDSASKVVTVNQNASTVNKIHIEPIKFDSLSTLINSAIDKQTGALQQTILALDQRKEEKKTSLISKYKQILKYSGIIYVTIFILFSILYVLSPSLRLTLKNLKREYPDMLENSKRTYFITGIGILLFFFYVGLLSLS